MGIAFDHHRDHATGVRPQTPTPAANAALAAAPGGHIAALKYPHQRCQPSAFAETAAQDARSMTNRRARRSKIRSVAP